MRPRFLLCDRKVKHYCSLFLRKSQWKLHRERIITGWFTRQVRFQFCTDSSESKQILLGLQKDRSPPNQTCPQAPHYCLHQDSLCSSWECALKHAETLLVLVQQLWLCKLHLRASQRPSSFWAVHEDIFRKRQFGVLYLQGTGIWIVPTDSSYNVPSRRFIFMIERMEK